MHQRFRVRAKALTLQEAIDVVIARVVAALLELWPVAALLRCCLLESWPPCGLLELEPGVMGCGRLAVASCSRGLPSLESWPLAPSSARRRQSPMWSPPRRSPLGSQGHDLAQSPSRDGCGGGGVVVWCGAMLMRRRDTWIETGRKTGRVRSLTLIYLGLHQYIGLGLNSMGFHQYITNEVYRTTVSSVTSVNRHI